ncbi:hypothetical protein BS47DRAFT_1133499 [Hydnum rufescens UP504]|uniref:Uncharacterized protein n=1 Tax=Hydnum rufescens UP504 TaxID=1448309 RepID=A0A9P6ATL9_9AGAM|nr:hypothetical protein BS47DRAFT_1133499 [Hydnum rufescens UP504]
MQSNEGVVWIQIWMKRKQDCAMDHVYLTQVNVTLRQGMAMNIVYQFIKAGGEIPNLFIISCLYRERGDGEVRKLLEEQGLNDIRISMTSNRVELSEVRIG